MRDAPHPRRRALHGLLALPAWAGAVGAAGCASTAAVPPPAGMDPLPIPTLRAGDRWTYRLIDRYNGGDLGRTRVTVTAVAPEIVLRIEPGDGGAPLEERWVRPWVALVDAGFDSTIAFESPMTVVPPAARVGQSIRETSRYRSDRSSGRLLWQQRVTVAGWERVRVPAGTFDALRVERLVQLEHPDRFRLDADRNETLWYVPQVGRWAMREWTGTFMPGAPTPRFGRAREDWVRWELEAWEPAATGRG